MTVALLGVGADSSNSSPTPPVYQDGRFEYIPIPESGGPDGTSETRTFGNTPLRHRNDMMADYLEYIKPTEDEGEKYQGDKLRDWPLHHDPNFEELTYGECTPRGAYINTLRQLNPDDLIAFYTGLEGEETRFKHRYVIGYFTIDQIVDFQNLRRGSQSRSFNDLDVEEQRKLIEEHSANAHSKRFKATGNLKHGDGLIITEGKKPGRLMERAFKISQHAGSGHYYLRDELQNQFSPTTGGESAYLGGFKQAHILDISPSEFLDIVHST